MKSLPELLSPAGSIDSLHAAVENGADAVYMGGKRFNARQNAENFGQDDLKRAIEYAHVRGVNIYITMNTLVTDAELPAAVEEAGAAYLAGADALIVQDLGLAAALRRHIPGLPLHLSTQGTIWSLEGIEALVPLGFSRVILARELSLEEVASITRRSPVPVEVFAHGALCVCVSGQCLMSSFIGSRSGNRGLCAQPCRLPYALDGAKGYLLSPKDLCTLEFLPELVSTGVSALKIEGRMKQPEYVAIVTSVYRKYLDWIASGKEYHVDAEDFRALLQVFNRGGFTRGYLKGVGSTELICRDRPKNWGVPAGQVVAYRKATGAVEASLTASVSLGDGVEVINDTLPGGIVTSLTVNGEKTESAGPGRAELRTVRGDIKPGDLLVKTSDKTLNDRARATYTGRPQRKVKVSGSFSVAVGEPMHLEARDGEGRKACAISAAPAEQAETRPLTEETARAQFLRTGDTPFEFSDCQITVDGKAAARLSELNALRRDALAKLEALRADRYPERQEPGSFILPKDQRAQPKAAKLAVYLYRWREDLAEVLAQADRVYVPFEAAASGKVRFAARPKEVMAWLPAVSNGNLDALMIKHAGDLKTFGLDGVLLGNPGHIAQLKGCGLPLLGDASWNVFNSRTLGVCAGLGLKGVMLSQELSLAQIEALPEAALEKEAAVYGRQPLMLSAHCPVGSELGHGRRCGLCGKGGQFTLTDRTGARFPVLCDALDCRSMVLNADVLYVPGLAKRLASAGVSVLRLYLHDEPPEEAARLLALYRGALAGGVAEAEAALTKGFTKGHYFRGV